MIVTNVKAALLAAYNKANNIKPAVTLDDINWGVPEVWLQGQCNSRILLTASANSANFGGTQTLYYTRRRINEELFGVKIPGKPGDYARLHDVIKVLREKLGVPLYENEINDRAIAGSTVTIDTTVACLAYLPAGSITLEYQN